MAHEAIKAMLWRTARRAPWGADMTPLSSRAPRVLVWGHQPWSDAACGAACAGAAASGLPLIEHVEQPG